MTELEFSEEQAFSAILEWSLDRPRWQRDALRRLMEAGSLVPADIGELEIICCDSSAPATPLERSHLKPANLSGKPISILRVIDPKGINALPGWFVWSRIDGGWLARRANRRSVVCHQLLGRIGYRCPRSTDSAC